MLAMTLMLIACFLLSLLTKVFENKDKIVLVMQYARGGELYEYVSERKKLPDNEARRIFRQIATAIYYCHKVCENVFEEILLDLGAESAGCLVNNVQ